MDKSITFVGLDVHKRTIVIALAGNGADREVRSYGTINGNLTALDKAVRKLESSGTELRFVYEAGPCGYEIYRHLTDKGYTCDVVAPSLIPRKPGDRVKTDHRDAANLAKLYRAGELTSVFVPDKEDEGMRDTTRCREDAIDDQRRARQRLRGFLLRHGLDYNGKSAWGPAHMNQIMEIRMPTPSQQMVLQEYVNAVNEATDRVKRITARILELLPGWRLAPLVYALQALRGVAPVVAVTMVAEIGDIGRFESAPQFMAFLGVIPSEHSSGGSVVRGSITKTGNRHARRVLIEAAQAYGFTERVSKAIEKRQSGLPPNINAISWKAQDRLCGKFRRLMAKGKPRNLVVTAIARELAGFMWAIARELAAPVAA